MESGLKYSLNKVSVECVKQFASKCRCMTISYSASDPVRQVVMGKGSDHDMIHYSIELLYVTLQVWRLTEICGICTGLIMSFIVVQ